VNGGIQMLTKVRERHQVNWARSDGLSTQPTTPASNPTRSVAAPLVDMPDTFRLVAVNPRLPCNLSYATIAVALHALADTPWPAVHRRPMLNRYPSPE
jgi:hypothetical protein